MLVATSRKDATNTVVVVGRAGAALLVDPAWTPDELDGLDRELRARRLRPTGAFATHAHFDHLLWHAGFGDVPRWATAETARRAGLGRDDLLRELGPGYDRQVLDRFGAVTAVLGDVVPWDGGRVQVLRHDAHVPGHAALWLPAQRTLIAGDMLSDTEVPLLDAEDPLGVAYAAGLEVLAPVAERATVVIPGHGRPGSDGCARLEADRRYLSALRTGVRPEDPRLRDVAMLGEWTRARQRAAEDREAQDRSAQDRSAQDRAAQDRAARDRISAGPNQRSTESGEVSGACSKSKGTAAVPRP